jgi:hypothetical protein
MMRHVLNIYLLGFVLTAISANHAQSPSPSAAGAIPVTADNFTRAETDSYFANIVK